MAQKEKIISFIKSREGAYVNDKDDLGKCTNSGVTLSTYQFFYGKEKTCEDLKKITDKEWNYIFDNWFWKNCKGDSINDQSVADMIVDFYWGSGIYAIKILQKCIGVKEDGIFGTDTLSKVNKSDPEKLFESLKKERISFYKRIAESKPKQKKFLNGWIKRAESVN